MNEKEKEFEQITKRILQLNKDHEVGLSDTHIGHIAILTQEAIRKAVAEREKELIEKVNSIFPCTGVVNMGSYAMAVRQIRDRYFLRNATDGENEIIESILQALRDGKEENGNS